MHTTNRSATPLRNLALACLDNVDELIEAFVTELADLEPYRDDGLIDLSEVREDAEVCFEMLLRVIAGLPLPGRISDVSERIGRRRAQLGVPLDVLLQAVRLDFRILWGALTRRADPDDLHALMDGAVTVWEAVERHTVGVHVSYLDEAAVLAREREQERSHLVAKLLDSNGGDARLRAQVATALDVEPSARFVVVAAHPSAQRALRHVADRLRTDGLTAHVHVDERRPILLAQAPHGARAVPSHWLHGVACGMGPVACGVAAVPRSVRVAIEVSKAVGPDTQGPVRLQEVWTEVVGNQLSEIGDVLAGEVLSGMEAITDHERLRLIETANSYFDTGSVRATAKTLFCHRNTVLNRLRRLGELTGGDLNSPEHAALVLLALRVHTRHMAGGPET